MYDLIEGNTIQGPFTGQQVKSLAKEGKVKDTAKVRRHPDGGWHSILAVKQLSQFFDPTIVRGAAIMDLHTKTGKPLFECEQIVRSKEANDTLCLAEPEQLPADPQDRIKQEVAALHRIGVNAGVKTDSAMLELHERTGKPLVECKHQLEKENYNVRRAESNIRHPDLSAFHDEMINGVFFTGKLVLFWIVVTSPIWGGLLVLVLWLLGPILMFLAGTAFVFFCLYLLFDIAIIKFPLMVISFIVGMFLGGRK